MTYTIEEQIISRTRYVLYKGGGLVGSYDRRDEAERAVREAENWHRVLLARQAGTVQPAACAHRREDIVDLRASAAGGDDHQGCVSCGVDWWCKYD